MDTVRVIRVIKCRKYFFITGVCPSTVKYDIVDGKIYNLKYDKGCDGNSKFITKLVEGMEVERVIEIAEGIQCGKKGTSCANELAKTLKEIL